MEIQLTTAAGQASKQSVEVSDAAFSRDFNEALIHQVVTAYMAGARRGTRAQKNRSDVSGSGIKPWRQKGTGRARAGSIRSPLWRSGGTTFAARPQDFSQKVNKKMYRSAMQSILSELLRQQRLIVVESLTLEDHKTKAFKQKLESLGLADVLIVTDEADKNLTLAARNIPHVSVCTSSEINPLALLRNEKVLMTVDTVKKIEGMLA